MGDIFEPTRGGVRGGRDQFKWEDVKTDKDRENYLGHSLKAPLASQERYEFDWYTKNRDSIIGKDEERNIIKDVESRAMAAALGSSYALIAAQTPKPQESTVNRMMFTPNLPPPKSVRKQIELIKKEKKLKKKEKKLDKKHKVSKSHKKSQKKEKERKKRHENL